MILCSSLAFAAGPQTAPKAAKPAAKPAPKAAATAAPAASPEEAKLRERVNGYWKTRATMNLQDILPFYEAAFRSNYTPVTFATNFRRLNRFAPEFMGIESVIFSDPKRAAVRVKLRTKPPILDGQDLISSSEEIWVLEDGNWFHAGEAMIPNI